MKLGRWSTTPGSNNSTPPDGWPEGQAPSTVNDCAREMMASIRTVFLDAQYVDQDFTPTYISATTFSVTGNQTSAIHAGRRLKIYDATAGVATTIYATVVTASFTALTTIQVSADSGQLTSSLSSFALAILSRDNDSLPRGLPISASAIGTENLTVNGTTTASGAVSLLTTLSVSGATVLKGALSVGGAATLASTLAVSGAAILNTTLSVSGASVLKGTLNVEGATSLSGAVALGTTLSVSGATVLKGALSVGGAVNLASTLTVGGAVAVAGAVRFDGTLSVSGTVVAANVAKAWCAFSGVGIVTLAQSFNVTSITDNGVGQYVVNLTTALSGSGYAVVGFVENNNVVAMILQHSSADTKTNTAYGLQCSTTGTTLTDAPVVHVTFYGT